MNVRPFLPHVFIPKPGRTATPTTPTTGGPNSPSPRFSIRVTRLGGGGGGGDFDSDGGGGGVNRDRDGNDDDRMGRVAPMVPIPRIQRGYR